MDKLSIGIDMKPAFRLANEIQANSESAQLKKAESTRLRIMAATAKLLDTVPYAQLRAIDVAAEAKLSQGAMYRYFRDIPDLVTQVIELHEREICKQFPVSPSIKEGYDYPNIVKGLSWHLACYLRNRGLFRLMFTQADQLPGVMAINNRLSLALHEQLGKFVVPPPLPTFDKSSRILAGQLIGGSMDELYRQLFQSENSTLPIPNTTQALFNLVQLCSVLRYRLMHGRDPDPKTIRAVAREFDLSFFDECIQSREHKRATKLPQSVANARGKSRR